MNTKTDTPRTDAECFGAFDGQNAAQCVTANFARKLERELAAATVLRAEVAQHQERFEALFAWAKLNTRLDPQHATLEQMLQDVVAFQREQRDEAGEKCVYHQQRADKFWLMLCDTAEALGKVAPEAAPYTAEWARQLRADLAIARELIQQLLNVAENCDETGYIDGEGFVDIDALHEKARAELAKRDNKS